MPDQLSELQECVDQLGLQMYSSLFFVANAAVPAQIDGQPWMPPDGLHTTSNGVTISIDAQPDTNSTQADTQASATVNEVNGTVPPEAIHPSTAQRNYRASLRELAQDLMIKEQQIEGLAKDLPGLLRSQEEQERVIKDLEKEAQELEVKAKQASEQREALIKRVEQTMMKIRRV